MNSTSKHRGKRKKTSGKSQSPAESKRRLPAAWRWTIGSIAVVFALVVGAWGWRAIVTQRIEALKLQVDRAVRSGRWDAAEQAAAEWARSQRNDAEAWLMAARAAWEQGDAQRAVAYLSSIPDPAPLDAYLQLGYLQMEALNDPLACVATCQRTIQYYPDDRETHQRLLYFYAMTCQSNPLRDEVRRAVDFGADTKATYAYLLAGQWLRFNNGVEVNQRWLQRYPNEEVFEVAAVLNLTQHPLLEEIVREQIGAAEEEPRPREFGALEVRRLLNKYPQNIELLAEELRNRCRAGEIHEVARLLNQAPPEAIQDNRFWRFKGWLHATQEQWKQAREAYQKGLQLAPWDWATRLELATVVRITEGVKAAEDIQRLADTGKQIVIKIRSSKNIHELEPPDLYRQMADYLRACGASELGDRLEQLLRSSS